MIGFLIRILVIQNILACPPLLKGPTHHQQHSWQIRDTQKKYEKLFISKLLSKLSKIYSVVEKNDSNSEQKFFFITFNNGIKQFSLLGKFCAWFSVSFYNEQVFVNNQYQDCLLQVVSHDFYHLVWVSYRT